MYRQITVTNFSFNNIKILTKAFLINDQNTAICLRKYSNLVKDYKNDNFTNKLYANLRFSSSHQINTEISNNIKIPKKKIKNDKYVELLEVGLTTKEIKARVKNLRSKKLSEFIEKSDYLVNRKSGKYLVFQLTPEEKEKWKIAKRQQKKDMLKLRKMSYEKFKSLNSAEKHAQPIEYQEFDIDMIESSAFQAGEYDSKPLIFFNKGNASISDEHKEYIISSFHNLKDMIENIKIEQEERNLSSQFKKNLTSNGVEVSVSPSQCENHALKSGDKCSEKPHKYKKRYHKSLEQEKSAKYKSILINLSTYIDICASSGILSRAFSALLFYRERCKKLGTSSQPRSIPIEIYNIIMHGYAKKGEFSKIESVLQILNDDSTELNHQTFASILECLGRLAKNEDNIILIAKYVDIAKNKGFSLNDIVDRSKFQYDELEIILDAIRRIEPKFQPKFTPPNLKYSNVLLNSLNEGHNEDNQIDSPSKTNVNHANCDYTKKELHSFAKEQLLAELRGTVSIKSIEETPDFPNSELYRKKFEDLNVLWKSQICTAINRDLNALRAQVKHRPNGLMTYYAYMKTLDSKMLADILLQEVKKLSESSESFSPTVSQLYKELGQQVQAKYHIESKKQNGVLEKTGNIYREYCQSLQNGDVNYNTRQIWQLLIHENRSYGPSMDINEMVWPNNVLINVGKFLYNILIRDIKIDSNILKANTAAPKKNLLPAFYTLYRNHGRLVKEEVKPHPILSRLVRVSKQKILMFNANQIPMLCPPQPWSTPVNGGYLLSKSDLIRLPYQAIQQWTRINEMQIENIYPALDSLNQLSSIPWRVNVDILDVILEVFRGGGDHKLDVPESPNSLPPLPSISEQNLKLTSSERAQHFKQKMARRRKQGEMYSLWCDTLYRLSLANHYRDRVFWLPHNMDFRGRVYPIPPHLNHLGSDLARSMLVFDKKRRLGPDGFMWLKLHCINLTGLKKRDSVRERILYAEQVMSEILDSANNPLTGRKWWTKSEEPWQTLACCMEIAKVMNSPNHEDYMSSFPIHQDGSCNGLQHYAALGRDMAGAISVNLSPSEIPQDVYSAIATLVEKTRQTDANNGLEVAKILDGFVKRKVIKQTVMTTVYGVTRYGARLQIARQLKDIEDFPKEWVWPASTYLTTKTFDSLREMFTSAKEIQDWFTDCARFISQICMQNVEWVTPLGLPVVQPYNRIEHTKPTKSIQVGDTMSLDMYEKPNIMKQKNAFPPNFIHSLDSSHMMLTSLFCERNRITFVSVHDCFWTHASTVPDMNKICRKQFVALHSQPILEDLSNFMVNKYSSNESELNIENNTSNVSKRNVNEVLKQVPQKGSFDLETVLDSIYFFS